MKEFKVVSKTFIKSKNSISKILLNYTLSLLMFIILIIIYNLIKGNINLVLNLLLSLLVTTISSIVFEYIINLISKEKDIKLIFTTDNIIPISLILGLFTPNINIIITIISVLITLIIRKLYKGINISSTLYGILFILLYKYYKFDLVTPLINLKNLNYIGTYEEIIKSNGSLLTYILGSHYLSPLISIISFIYLFIKKSIKYNLFISYILTISIMLLIVGIFNNMNIWYLFFHITTGSLLFLSVYCLTDYRITPQTSEGQILYGIILGIITTILRFIIPELSVIISLIIGPLILTKIIEKLSPKLKYNQKTNIIYLTSSIIIALITTTIITIII